MECYIEDKQKVCDKLLLTLRETRDFRKLVYLHYLKQDKKETVRATFEDKSTMNINVSFDSEATMIKDIVNKLIKN